MEIECQYNQQQTFYFPLVDRGTADFESTPVTFATGDTQLMIDGGAFANTTNNPVHEGNGIYSLVLTAAETQFLRGVVTIIDQTATKLWEDQALILFTGLSGQIAAASGIIEGEVDTATFTATTTALEGFRTAPNLTEEATPDHYIGRLLLFTTGALKGQMTDITDYELANSKEKLTYTATTEAPSDGDKYVIL